ncbi:MAG: DNA alkylation response protein, partial [Burkholderiales bacterium]
MDLSTPPSGTRTLQGSAAIPDGRGLNQYTVDPMAAALFGLYLPADLFAHLTPHFERLGGLAGSRLDELALIADKNPPTLSVRDRRG